MDKQAKLIERLFKDTLIILLLSMFVSIVGSVADGAITGNFLGTKSIAAFGMTLPYQKFCIIFSVVIMIGMQILCSKSLGAGKLREANEFFSMAVTAVIIVAVLMMGGTILFSAQIADLLGAKASLGEIRTLTIDFLEAYSLGLPAMALVTVLTPIMQLDGDRRRAIVSAAVLSGCDIAGDLLVVFAVDGGLWEIGFVTAISYWIATGVLVLHFFKPNAGIKFLREVVSLSYLKQMLLIGLPVSFGLSATTLRIGLFTRTAVALAGGEGVAAYTTIENIFGLLTTIPRAIGSTIQMIGGILINEHDRHSILIFIKVVLKYSMLITLTITAGIFLAATSIADFYIHDADPVTQKMTTEGIHLFIAFLPLYTLALIFQYFYQAYGRFKLVSVFAVMDNIGFVVPILLLLTAHFGLAGIWLTFPLIHLAYLLLIFFMTCRHCGRITFKLEDFLLLPKDFDVPEDKQLNITVTSEAEALDLSERTQTFCEAQGIDGRRSMFASICIKEMAYNIVDYGFDDGKKHFVDIRVIVKGEQVIIRIRDDCRPFDPKKWADIHNPEDPTAHIGIRLVRKIATEFEYVNVLNINNLIIKI